MEPVTEMLVKVKIAFPALVRVMPWDALGVPWVWLPKVRVGGERLTLAPRPVPVRLTLWVLPATLLVLSVIVKVAVRVPKVAGVKVTLMVQLPLAATEVPQVLA